MIKILNIGCNKNNNGFFFSKLNIFDNMFVIMEKYVNNLEVFVVERIEQLLEEKQMIENFLYRMLLR